MTKQTENAFEIENAFEEKLTAFVLLKQEIKALKEEVAILRVQILTEIKEKDIDCYETNELTLKYSMRNRNALDKEAITEYLSENTDKTITDFQVQSEYELLTVKQKGGD